MTDHPCISVVLPVRDAQSTIAEALESIRTQTLHNWECIIIDDHSKDGTSNEIQRFIALDSRFRVLSAQGKGIVSALNQGIDAAKADWIARMDADDISLPTRFEKKWGLLQEDSTLQVISSEVAVFPEMTNGMASYIDWLNSLKDPSSIRKDMFVESPIAHPAALFLKKSVVDLGGYREGDFPEDYDLWLRLHATGARFRKVPEILLRWRESETRLSRQDPRYSLDAFRRLKAFHLVEQYLPSKAPVQIWGAGPDGKKWAKELAQHGIQTLRFFDIDPRKIGGRVGGTIPVLSWTELPNFREEALILGAVGAKGARVEIRNALSSMGVEELQHFVFVQ